MNEKDLIQKTLQGDEEAFASLVGQNREHIFKHCLSIVHDEEIAKDLVQETFLQAFQHLPTFRMESRFSTWIWRIAHNLSLNYIKKHPHIEQEFKEEILLVPPPLDEAATEERIAALQGALQRLAPKYREVIEMYDLKHIPQKQIANELGIPYGTVRSRLHYARKALKRFLEEA